MRNLVLSLIFIVLPLCANAQLGSFDEQANYHICQHTTSNCNNMVVRNIQAAKTSIIYPSSWHNSAEISAAILSAKKRGVVTEMLEQEKSKKKVHTASGLLHASSVSVIDNQKVIFSYPSMSYTIEDEGFAQQVSEQVLGNYRSGLFGKRMGNACRLIIPQRRNGNYEVYGAINQSEVKFLVDTGATYVTVPAYMANELGLEPKIASRAQTATSRVTAHITWIDELKVGPITLKHVKAALLPQSNNRKVLLGMSALRQLDLFQHKEDLVLIQYRKNNKGQPCLVDANAMIR